MKIIILVSFFILIETILEFCYKKTTSYKSSLNDMKKFAEGVPNGIEIANIGSGPGMYAITYENIKKRGFNFATAPQSFKYGFRLLKHYAEKIEKGAVIIIFIMCPLSFGKNSHYKNKSYSDKFYPFLNKKEIDNYSYWRAFLMSHPFLVKCFKYMKYKIFAIVKRKYRQLTKKRVLNRI